VRVGSQGSEGIGCKRVAERLRRMNDEITCGLSPRVRRQWHGAA
jgi:hypothetical protein